MQCIIFHIDYKMRFICIVMFSVGMAAVASRVLRQERVERLRVVGLGLRLRSRQRAHYVLWDVDLHRQR